MKERLSLVISLFALAVALTGVGAAAAGIIVTSKQIQNGTIRSVDISRNGVRSTDVANGTIDSVDVGGNEIKPSDVEMPAPIEVTPDGVSGPVTGAYSRLATVAVITKVQDASPLEITLGGAVAGGPGTNCAYQLRVNGAPALDGGGEAFSPTGAVNVSAAASFRGVPAGQVAVEVWARATSAISPNPTCAVGPSDPGIETTVLVVEQVV